MALSSMTGFARQTGSSGPFQWAWELKSVNGRGLDIKSRVPSGFDMITDAIRLLIQKNLTRGQCHLSLIITKSDSPPQISIHEKLLNELIQKLDHIPLPAHITPASLDGLLSLPGIIQYNENIDPSSNDEIVRQIQETGEQLIPALTEARRKEGLKLEQIIKDQMVQLLSLVDEAEHHPSRQPEAIKEKLTKQVKQLLDTDLSLDPDRLHQEAVLIAARVDIREELDRLKAHIEAVHSLLAHDNAVGRRLDFLAQEFGRETNTLCAKANDVSLSRIGLQMKAQVEQFREQVQNVE